MLRTQTEKLVQQLLIRLAPRFLLSAGVRAATTAHAPLLAGGGCLANYTGNRNYGRQRAAQWQRGQEPARPDYGGGGRGRVGGGGAAAESAMQLRQLEPLKIISRTKQPKLSATMKQVRKNQQGGAADPSHQGDGFLEFNQLDPRLKADLLEMDRDGDGAEPNVQSFNLNYDAYVEEQQELYLKQRRTRMAHKHFGSHISQSQELNLLTFAEKEKIRYLYQHESWTVDMIAATFPISSFGADKLVHSRCQLRSEEVIMEHDKNIVRKLKMIQNGEIELTPELEQRLKKRSTLTLFVGARWDHELYRREGGGGEGGGVGGGAGAAAGFNMNPVEKKKSVGEFESLVTITKKGEREAATGPSGKEAAGGQLMVQEQPQPGKQQQQLQQVPKPLKDRQRQNQKKVTTGRGRGSFQSDLDGFADIRDLNRNYVGGGGGGGPDEEKEFRFKNVNPNRALTFSEFQKLFQQQEQERQEPQQPKSKIT